MILYKHHKRLNKNKIKAESNKTPKHKPVKTRHVPPTPLFLRNPRSRLKNDQAKSRLTRLGDGVRDSGDILEVV